jgi:fumarate hydratase class II
LKPPTNVIIIHIAKIYLYIKVAIKLLTEAMKMEYRIEHDSMGEVKVPADKYWAAQTERSHENFKIGVGIEVMPREITHAFGVLKKAAAIANNKLKPEKMTDEKLSAISQACDEVMSGELNEHFPLVVWQTGSGTQSNMNANEVIANRGNEIAGAKILHPNDDINMSQSSNDTFPTAMSIAAVLGIEEKIFPAIDKLVSTLKRLEKENEGIVKSGRTHLQDATPITFSQEISGWRTSLEKDRRLLEIALPELKELALGGTAVGTGLNAPAGFDVEVAKAVTQITGKEFITAPNKFHALTSKDEIVFAHGALKALACDLMKMANDVRWLASGPRVGLGEIKIPENEPGSSIMPGKVNPTQCEAVTMVAVQVMGNDATIGFAASQGNFELNVFMPVIIYNFTQSVRLLSEVMVSFNDNCAVGITANKEKMHSNLHNSLMLVTALNPYIGYENSAKTAKKAFKDNISLKEACVELGFLTEEKFDEVFHPEQMV